MKEVIGLHVGGAGVNLGTELWRTLVLDHGAGHYSLDTVSTVPASVDVGNLDRFFAEAPDNSWKPRAVFVDSDQLEPPLARGGKGFGQLFATNQAFCVQGKESCCFFTRGAYTVGKLMVEPALEGLRLQMEAADAVDGLLMTCALGGGAGSGISSALADRIAVEWPKTTVLLAPIFPNMGRFGLGEDPMHPYNTLLGLYNMNRVVDVVVPANNASLYRAVERLCPLTELDNDVHFAEANRMHAAMLSLLTAPLRWPQATGPGSLRELAAHLRSAHVPQCRLVLPSLLLGPSAALPSWGAPLLSPEAALLDVYCQAQQRTIAAAAAGQPLPYRRHRRLRKAALYGERAVWTGGAWVVGRGPGLGPLAVDGVLAAVLVEAERRWGPRGMSAGVRDALVPRPFHCAPRSAMDAAARKLDAGPAAADAPTDSGLSGALLLQPTSLLRHALRTVLVTAQAVWSKRSYAHWLLGEGLDEDFMEDALAGVASLVQDLKAAERPATASDSGETDSSRTSLRASDDED